MSDGDHAVQLSDYCTEIKADARMPSAKMKSTITQRACFARLCAQRHTRNPVCAAKRRAPSTLHRAHLYTKTGCRLSRFATNMNSTKHYTHAPTYARSKARPLARVNGCLHDQRVEKNTLTYAGPTSTKRGATGSPQPPWGDRLTRDTVQDT